MNIINDPTTKLRNGKKSQVFSLDFIFAAVVFIIILIMTVTIWNSLSGKIIYVRTMREMSVISTTAMSGLVDSEGYPKNWHLITGNLSNQIPGLMSTEPGIIDEDKANRIIQLGNDSYDSLRKALGIMGPGYDFILQIGENKTGKYENSSTDVFGIDRFMQYKNGTIVQIKLRVWK